MRLSRPTVPARTPIAAPPWSPAPPRASARPPRWPWPTPGTRWCSAPAGSTGSRRLAAKIRADGGEALALPLDLTDDASIDAFAAAAAERLGPIEVVVSNAGEVPPATALAVDPDELRPAGAGQPARRPPARARASARRWSARQRGDIVFVTSDVVRVPRTHMAAYVAVQARRSRASPGPCRWSSRAPACGSASCAPARRPPSRGATWDPAVIDDVLDQLDRLGPHAPRRATCRPRDVAAAVLAVVSDATRHPPHPRRGRARGPRGGPVDDGRPTPTLPRVCRSVSGDDGGTGHLEELRARSDRADGAGARRVRRRRRLPPRRPRRRAAHRPRGQRGVLPGPGGGARPGRGLPVHDADLRRGRGVRRLARGAAQGAPQPGAARQVHARPRRDDRRTRSTAWSPAPPTAARSTCSTGSRS